MVCQMGKALRSNRTNGWYGEKSHLRHTSLHCPGVVKKHALEDLFSGLNVVLLLCALDSPALSAGAMQSLGRHGEVTNLKISK